MKRTLNLESEAEVHMLLLHQLAGLREDKSESLYDFLSFFVKFVYVVGRVTYCPTYITPDIKLRENKAITSNALGNLENPTVIPKNRCSHYPHHSRM